MNNSLKVMLNQIKDGLLDIGMSIDIQDHGSASEANEVYDRGRNVIQKALDEASTDDREVFGHLFGFNTDFNKTSWSVPYEYILKLLDFDPDISLIRLRNRVAFFNQTIDDLKTSNNVISKVLPFRYTKEAEPSLLSAFLQLIATKVEPPGWYYEFDGDEVTSFHLTLGGEGARIRSQNQMFEYDVILQNVWLHCLHPMRNRTQEIQMICKNIDACKEIIDALVQNFKNHSWEACSAY